MEENNNYPIKYSVLELKERGGYLVGYKDIILGYIVSKCYVVESTIKYSSNGNFKIFHRVVFPFKNINIHHLKSSLEKKEEYYIGEKNIPRYDACGEIYPVNIVSNIYENYDDAMEEAKEKNSELQQKIIVRELSKPVDQCEKEFKEQLYFCQAYEQLVTKETNDMNVTNDINTEIVMQKLLRKKM